MLTKVKKGKSVVTASIALLFLILFLNFNRANLEIFLFDTLESVNSLDPGYSSLKEFLGLNNLVSLGNTNTEIIVGLSKHFLTTGLPKIPSILFSKISGNEIRPKIEDLNFEDALEALAVEGNLSLSQEALLASPFAALAEHYTNENYLIPNNGVLSLQAVLDKGLLTVNDEAIPLEQFVQ